MRQLGRNEAAELAKAQLQEILDQAAPAEAWWNGLGPEQRARFYIEKNQPR